MKESCIEKQLEKMVRKKSGLCFKFVSPGSPGVPDRIVITPDGRIIFVELKTETGSLQKIQQWQIERLRNCGADVRVIKGLQEVKDFVREVFGE